MLTPNKKGQQAEGALLAAFLKRGLTVLLPFGYSSRYDMIFDIGGRFYRVQCKRGRIRNGAIEFNTRSMNNVTHQKRDYRGQVEFLAVWEPTTDTTYLVEPEKVGKDEGYLRLDSKYAGRKGIQLAKNFALDCVLKRIGGVG